MISNYWFRFQVKYICDIKGCQVLDKEAADDVSASVDSETLVISRTSRTVRAVEMISGVEK